jgi:hypothetical protein
LRKEVKVLLKLNKKEVRMMRSLDELEVRVTLPLSRISQELRERCVEIARAKSPSAAFDRGYEVAILAGMSQNEALGIAKATRWLSVIRRDYGKEAFEKVVSKLTMAKGLGASPNPNPRPRKGGRRWMQR